MSKKPNFLFLITDQQRADWLGCYGHPVVRTPNIDAIARTGTRFDDFHVACPVCMPNRASLMTGRYPSVHGLRYNGCYLPPDSTTFVDVLAQAGYRTAGIGKSHLQPFTGIGAEQRVDRDELGHFEESRTSVAPPFVEEQAHLTRSEVQADFPLPYYGFQHIDMLTAHGFKSGGHYTQWLLEHNPDGLDLLDPKNQLAHDYSCPQAVRVALPESLYPTSYVKEKALDYLDSQQNSADPFFAFVSFNDPHHPFNPPGKYWDMYHPDDFSIPPDFDQLVDPIPPLQKVHQQYLAGEAPKTMETVFMASARQIQEAMALTGGLVTMIDDAVGEIIERLKANGQYENTVIIYTSDHGDYLGDYGLMLKGALPYRGITRVPFIWSDPADRMERTCDGLTSTLDIAPTLIDRAGLKPFWGIQGKNILPLVTGEIPAVRDHHLIEYEDGMARFGFDQPALVRSPGSKQYRLTLYKDQSFGELYDLQQDQDERRNLFDDPDYATIKAGLINQLAMEMMANMETSPRAMRRA